MSSYAVVGGGEDATAARAPRFNDSVDGRRVQVRPVRKDDDRGLGIAQSRKATAQRRPRAAVPGRARHDASIGRDLVGSLDDDNLAEGLGGA